MKNSNLTEISNRMKKSLSEIKSMNNKQIRMFLISEVNKLKQDIEKLEEFRDHTLALFPQKINFNSIHVLENKLKTISQFYSTILSYKQELIRLLLKLEAMIQPELTETDYKQIVSSVLTRIYNETSIMKSKQEKIEKILNQHKDKFLVTSENAIKTDLSETKELINNIKNKKGDNDDNKK